MKKEDIDFMPHFIWLLLINYQESKHCGSPSISSLKIQPYAACSCKYIATKTTNTIIKSQTLRLSKHKSNAACQIA